MCLLLFAYGAHVGFPLIVAANRDEFHRRPAAPAGWWPAGDILAGRDLEAGGSWFGVNRQGRFAAVTNFRDPASRRSGVRSRGEVVVETLRTPLDGRSWLRVLEAGSGDYNGFSLVFGGVDGVFSYGNRGRQSGQLPTGVYGLSNHLLETPWPKVQRGKTKLQAYLASDQPPELEPLLALLDDREPAADAELPATGVSMERERLLSPMFIVSPDYGTRASTGLIVDQAGEVRFMERTFDAGGRMTAERSFRFRMSSA
jgi:uncharacterized protein with NRDE domain